MDANLRARLTKDASYLRAYSSSAFVGIAERIDAALNADAASRACVEALREIVAEIDRPGGTTKTIRWDRVGDIRAALAALDSAGKAD